MPEGQQPARNIFDTKFHYVDDHHYYAGYEVVENPTKSDGV
jgi:hypothetical protein